MKKIIAFFLLITFLFPVIALSEFDYSSMTNEELKEIISLCSAELRARETIDPDWVLLFDCDTVKIYQYDNAEISIFGSLRVPVVVINEMDYDIIVSIKKAKCNGWEIYSDGPSASAQSKKKDTLSFSVDEAFVESIDQINSLEFIWNVIIRKEKAETYYTSEPEEHCFW